MFGFSLRTTAGILASFTKTLTDLEAVASERAQLRDDRKAAADVALKEAADHEAERVAAANVATKLRALIG